MKQDLLLNADSHSLQKLFYLQSLISVFFIAAIPFFLYEYIYINHSFHRLNRWLIILTIPLSLSIIIPGIFHPELFNLQGYVEPDFPYNFIRTAPPPFLYNLNDLMLLILLLYTFITILISLIKKTRPKEILILFIGILISNLFFLSGLVNSLWNFDFLFLGDFPISRITIGLTVSTLSIFWSILRMFLKDSKQVQLTKEMLSKSQKDLIKMAYSDDLTKVGNRAAAMRDLKRLLEKKELNAAVILMNINHFSKLNESYGNQLADKVLRLQAQRFKENLPPSMEVYRVGGDEFIFILPHCNHNEMPREIAVLLQNWLRQGVEIEKRRYYLYATFALCRIPKHGKDSYEVFRNLKSTLRIAKKSGTVIKEFKPAHYINSLSKIQAVENLKGCITHDRFHLLYQPMVNQKNEIVALEALLRLDVDIPGFKTPDKFIPLAEGAGLMGDLAQVIMDRFSKDYSMFRRENINQIFSLNLSGEEFFSNNLCEDLNYYLEKQDVPLDRVQVEITENILMQHWDKAEKVLQRLTEKGIKIALDNFGLGQSSLKYLHRLPIDSLKLHGNFHRELSKYDKSKKVLLKIIELASELNIRLFAEGVETPREVDLLTNLGCSYFQGFLFYPPMEVKNLIKVLHSTNS
ncbi:MAG: phosphodiesterase [Spirochaetaceae bacterium]|nr:phosphodiesterase [Spirochaetaceae bacterium]